MLKLFISSVKYSIVHSTDFDYVKRLENCAKDLNAEAFSPQRFSWSLKENFYEFVNILCRVLHLKYRIKFSYHKSIFPGEFFERKYDLVYAQERCPNNVETPVFLENTFWDNGQNQIESPSIKDWFENKAVPLMMYNLSRKCFVNLKSEKEKENVVRLFPNEAHRIVNLPFLLPGLNAISSDDLVKKHMDDNVIRFLFVGTQAKRKGLPRILEAYSKFYSSLSSKNVELHIVSSFADGKINIPQSENIVLHGKLSSEKTQALMKTSHVFIMTSGVESYGLVYIEAMSKGCIVIARDFYPQKEILDFGKIGLLANPNDTESILEKITEAYRMSQQDRIKMSENALQKFVREYSYSSAIEKYKEVFAKCVEYYK